MVGGGGVSSSSAVAWGRAKKQVVQLAFAQVSSSLSGVTEAAIRHVIFMGEASQKGWRSCMVMTSCGMDTLIILCNA